MPTGRGLSSRLRRTIFSPPVWIALVVSLLVGTGACSTPEPSDDYQPPPPDHPLLERMNDQLYGFDNTPLEGLSMEMHISMESRPEGNEEGIQDEVHGALRVDRTQHDDFDITFEGDPHDRNFDDRFLELLRSVIRTADRYLFPASFHPEKSFFNRGTSWESNLEEGEDGIRLHAVTEENTLEFRFAGDDTLDELIFHLDGEFGMRMGGRQTIRFGLVPFDDTHLVETASTSYLSANPEGSPVDVEERIRISYRRVEVPFQETPLPVCERLSVTRQLDRGREPGVTEEAVVEFEPPAVVLPTER